MTLARGFWTAWIVLLTAVYYKVSLPVIFSWFSR